MKNKQIYQATYSSECCKLHRGSAIFKKPSQNEIKARKLEELYDPEEIAELLADGITIKDNNFYSASTTKKEDRYTFKYIRNKYKAKLHRTELPELEDICHIFDIDNIEDLERIDFNIYDFIDRYYESII